MVLLLSLAILDAFTTFEIATWGLVSIALLVLAGTTAFGYFSLGRLPTVVAQIRDMSVSVRSGGEARIQEPNPGPEVVRQEVCQGF